MSKTNNLFKTLVVSWWLMLWWQWLNASVQTQRAEMVDTTKNELVTDFNLQQEQNLDSLYNITKEIQKLLWSDIYEYYWYEQSIEKLEKLEQEYKEEVKKLKLNKTIFRYSEREFDQKMENIKEKIISNPDNFGKFNSKWNFIINEWSYKKLLEEEFPEFYNFYKSDTEDVYNQLWNKNMGKYFFNPEIYKHSRKSLTKNEKILWFIFTFFSICCFFVGFISRKKDKIKTKFKR